MDIGFNPTKKGVYILDKPWNWHISFTMAEPDKRPQFVHFSKLPESGMHSLEVYKISQWLGIVFGEVFSFSASSLAAWLGSLIVAGLSIWLLEQMGLRSLASETEQTAIVFAVSGLALVGLTFLLALIWSVIRSGHRLRDLGKWHDSRFVFRQPVIITSELLESKNNERLLLLKARGVPALSVIYCRLINPANSSHLQAILQSPFMTLKNWRNIVANRTWPTFADGPLSVAVKVGYKREFYLEWFMSENAIPHHLQVEMLSFEIQHSGEGGGIPKQFCMHVSQPTNGYDFYASP